MQNQNSNGIYRGKGTIVHLVEQMMKTVFKNDGRLAVQYQNILCYINRWLINSIGYFGNAG